MGKLFKKHLPQVLDRATGVAAAVASRSAGTQAAPVVNRLNAAQQKLPQSRAAAAIATQGEDTGPEAVKRRWASAAKKGSGINI